MSQEILSALIWSLVMVMMMVHQSKGEPKVCENLSTDMCKGLGYNQTYTPNYFNQRTQWKAVLQLKQYWPLVRYQCSSDLQFFLCSLYTPICDANQETVVPCRSVCERAKAGCEPIMHRFGYPWPAQLKCVQFPKVGDKDRPCLDKMP